MGRTNLRSVEQKTQATQRGSDGEASFPNTQYKALQVRVRFDTENRIKVGSDIIGSTLGKRCVVSID